MDWRKRKKELDKKYEYFWNNVGINGIDSKKEKGVDMEDQNRFYNELIASKCKQIAEFLMNKNESYAGSVFKPCHIMSNHSPIERVNIRIDDKLCRLKNSQSYDLDDDLLDLTGYLIIRMIMLDDIKAVKESRKKDLT